MYLLLIRHGETDWNNDGRIQGHTDTPLNARGIAQAEKLATRIAAEGPEVIYSSPLSRASMTAKIIASRCNLVPIFDDRLKEKGLGEMEGMTGADFKQRFPELYERWHTSHEHVPLPGEETPLDLQRRVQTFLDELRAKHPGSTRVAVVSHGGTIGMLIGTVIGLDVKKRFPFWFDNASVSHIDFTGARPRLRLLNDTCHLRNGNCE